jgi:NAD(P)-dependent dehydrogenase (short-subunit alcohol dehydrogenase family)
MTGPYEFTALHHLGVDPGFQPPRRGHPGILVSAARPGRAPGGGAMDCDHTHTVVTGASSGIGRATALRLAAAGQHVFAGVRSEAAGTELAAAARGLLTPVRLDVTDAEQVSAAAAAVAAHTDRLDGLVNNAGVGLAAPVELLPLDVFRDHLEVNVTGQLAVTQAFLPLLRAACGRIVVVSTIGIHFKPPFAGALDASKAALAMLADALRQEIAPWGVRVVLVEPASINSAAAEKVRRDAEAVLSRAPAAGRARYEDTFTAMLAVMTRRERAGSPPEVAAATIETALTAARPRDLYRTGRFVRRLALLSRLPTPLLDRVRRRLFGLPAPLSRVPR